MSLEIGNFIVYVKIKAYYRDWYGTVVEVDEENQRARIEWVVSQWKTKFTWESYRRLRQIDQLPIMKRKNKKEFVEVLQFGPSGWEKQANCRHLPKEIADLFTDYITEHPTSEVREVLTGICIDCPVMIHCRSEALLNGRTGWWGGQSEPERVRWAQNLTRKGE